MRCLTRILNDLQNAPVDTEHRTSSPLPDRSDLARAHRGRQVRRVAATFDLGSDRGLHGFRRFLKRLSREYGIRCVAISPQDLADHQEEGTAP